MWYLAADEATTGSGSNMLFTFGPIVLMFVVLYFLLIRPQQRKQKTRVSMLGQLKKGDKVVTIGGLHGTIMEITDDIVVLRVNDTMRMTFDRSAINSVTQSAVSDTQEKK
ncbi:preprotein translocase subunit YajC [Paenibacillus cymbidii]|uniref:preprotein translocase subunit YajC n=1 Tax=Paenibacillus cymbidii TaxID=1639034 RepID=UPI00107FF011|nr:preprotein translocase subunit YajC [Paenibacillus cymbidii]